MKTVRLSFAQSLKYKPPQPERTAMKSGNGMDFDVTFKEWPARGPMARTIRMQQKREQRNGDWRAVVPLRDTEGY